MNDERQRFHRSYFIFSFVDFLSWKCCLQIWMKNGPRSNRFHTNESVSSRVRHNQVFWCCKFKNAELCTADQKYDPADVYALIRPGICWLTGGRWLYLTHYSNCYYLSLVRARQSDKTKGFLWLSISSTIEASVLFGEGHVILLQIWNLKKEVWK